MKTKITFLCIALFLNVLVGNAQNFWQDLQAPYGGAIGAVAVNPINGDIIATTYAHGIYRSTDNGVTWMQTTLTKGTFRDIVINSVGDIFAGTPKDWSYTGIPEGVYRSTDNGVTWTAVNSGITDKNVWALAVNSQDDIFAASCGGGVYYSTDNGINWTAVNAGLPSLYVNSLAINSNDEIFVGSSFGSYSIGVYYSVNNGTSWTAVTTGLTSLDVRDLAINSSNHVFAATANGVYYSTNNGTNWTAVNSGLGLNIASLTINSNDDIFVTDYNSSVFKSISNGASWNLMYKVNGNGSKFGLAKDNNDNIYATSIFGLHRSTDGGVTWNVIGVRKTTINSLMIKSTGDIFASIDTVATFRSSDNGVSWTSVLGEAAYDICVNSKEDIIAEGWGCIYVSTDNGTSWDTTTMPVRTISLAVNSNDDIYAGTCRFGFNGPALGDGIYASTDNGTTWNFLGLANTSVRAIAVNSKNDIYAGLWNGGVYRSLDTGKTWSIINTGLWSFDISSLAINSKDDVFAGTKTGVYSLANNATSWVAGTGLSSAVYSLAIDSNDHIYAGTGDWFDYFNQISGTGVYQSIDDGATWTAVNSGLTNMDIHSLAINQNNELFAGTGGECLFKSSSPVTSAKNISTPVSGNYLLSQNYPNPFSKTTMIEFTIPKSGQVTLKVCNVLGEEVDVLLNKQLDSGKHKIYWNANNLPDGMYYYILQTDSYKESKKMYLIK